VDLDRHRFAALNTAHLADGAFVVVPAGTRTTEPIHLLFTAWPGESPRAVYPRVVLVVEDGAEAQVVEEYASAAETPYFTCSVTEIWVGENAALDHVRLERESDRGFHLGVSAAVVGRNGRYRSHAVSLGGRLTRLDLDVALSGEGAEGILNGLYLPSGRRHVDHHTRVEHRSPHTTSIELYKGVLSGKATAVFNGRIVIAPGAQQSDAAQTNNNLLLSGEALVNTNPELEIFADDVKARHGATIGQLEDDALFYLRSRGLDETSARRLLVYAFAKDLVERLPVPRLRDELAGVVETLG
jgi:Fe-S cluster assembly protein SufD